MNRLQELRQLKADKVKEAKEFLAANDEDALTEEQELQFQAFQAEIEKINDDIIKAEWLRDQELSISSAASYETGNDNSKITVGADPKKEYASLGEFLQDVASVQIPTASPSDKFEQYMTATGQGTNVGHDGGFLVKHDWSEALLERGTQEALVYPRCTRIPVGAGSDGIELPYVDETSRADGSRWGGVRVYRADEADTVTASKVKFGKHVLELEDLMAVAYASERSLRDASSLEAIMSAAFAEEFAFVIDNEILRGTGAGQCLGVISDNNNSLVTIAKETGQDANTLKFQNITKMRARMPMRSRRNAVWVINQDVEPQLAELSLPVGTGGLPAYLPASGLADEPFDRLYGRPVIVLEQASTLGTKGDIGFFDFSKYVIVEKGGIKNDSSIHVRFLYNERTFRWTTSINGMPVQRSAKTPAQGSNTQSPFITLETRA
ncbi:MAG: phage major capsid protein [Pseudomonadales bacterium]|nr:phage major capsid protein [Pseudomonadales bacterium]